MSSLDDVYAVTIEDFMSTIGFKVARSSSKYLFYYSPFRSESSPSFIVDRSKSRWSDPGHSISIKERKKYKWHSLIDLVMELNKCDFKAAKNFILGANVKVDVSREPIVDLPSIEVVSDNDLNDSYLIRYIKSRRIDIDLAKVYCRQVGVIFPQSKKNSVKEYFYVGFKNDKGGWELRSSGMKISTSPKYYTKFEGDNDSVCMFEGFFDFLSALTFYRLERFAITTIVLNSLVNLPYLTPFLSTKKNYLFWDNDESADNKIELLKEENIEFKDLRKTIYPEYNDFNDMLTNKKK